MRVFPGLEVLLKKELLKNRKIGLITNHTGNNFDLESNFDLMLRAGYKMTALFSPEHGIYGDHPDGQYVEGSTHTGTGIPIHSLYGATQKPKKDMLKNVDILVFDIPVSYTHLDVYKRQVMLSLPVLKNGALDNDQSVARNTAIADD